MMKHIASYLQFIIEYTHNDHTHDLYRSLAYRTASRERCDGVRIPIFLMPFQLLAKNFSSKFNC
jgi:hypothetical protein